MYLFAISRALWHWNWPHWVISLRGRRKEGLGVTPNRQSSEAIWSKKGEPWGKEAAVSRSRSVGKNAWQIPTTIYQAPTGNMWNSKDLNPRFSLYECFLFFFSYWCVSFTEENIYNCCQTPSVPLCLPSLLPCFYPQPGVHLGGKAAYNGPRVNHLQVSPDKSQYVCCAPSKSQQQLWGCAESSLWHSEHWPRWEAVCWGAYLNSTIWSASVALKALVCVSNGHSLEMPKNEPSSLDGQMAWRQWNLLIIWASCVMYCLNSKSYQNNQGRKGEARRKSGGKGGGREGRGTRTSRQEEGRWH